MKMAKWFFGILFLGVLITACKDDDPEPAATPFEEAKASNGGIMYDEFWAVESGFDQNDPNIDSFSAYSNFFRCKQCHAWDGLGNAGSYIGRAPKTSRPNVAAFNLYQMGQTESAQELFEEIKESAGRRDIGYDLSTYDPVTNSTEGDKMPNYSQILTDAQIWDIVKFLKKGMFDVSELYDATYSGTYPTGSADFTNIGLDGDAALGNAFYTSDCSGCHGADGTTISLEGKTLGKFVRSKPNEVQHKVKYGQLGSPMKGEFDITVEQMKDLYKACSDTTAFPN
jgi:mono/diheme cytochrome c family protein